MNPKQSSVLVVDDNADNRELLARQLRRQGHRVVTAENGRRALDLIQAQEFDLLLLDIMMPEMNGYQVLERLKADPDLRHLPVVVISALDDLDSIVRCIQLGAEDHLPKPFNRVILQARVGASLEKKRLRDQEQAYLAQLQAEQEKSERLLLNILPQPIAERLKQGQEVIADRFEEVTVLFADIVGFSTLWSSIAPTELVNWLNEIFSAFDQLADRHGLEKIKTIGDAYMVVGGLPTPRPDHAEAIAEMALCMQKEVALANLGGNKALQLRVGVDTGPVVAGVIGRNKFSYDLWGDTVNMASRMQTMGLPGCIQVTEGTYQRLRDKYVLEARGSIEVKNMGVVTTYLLTGRREA